MAMHKHSLLMLLLAFWIPSSALAGDAGRLHAHEKGIWSLSGTAAAERWIVIHDLPEAKRTGVYHIEVLAREKNEPKWKVTRLRPHLAITEQALDRSVVKPLSSGAVYPESFDDAYRRWKEEQAQGGAFVCETSVLECMGGK